MHLCPWRTHDDESLKHLTGETSGMKLRVNHVLGDLEVVVGCEHCSRERLVKNHQIHGDIASKVYLHVIINREKYCNKERDLVRLCS